MAIFKYIGIHNNGQKKSGIIVSDTENGAILKLKKRKVHIIDIKKTNVIFFKIPIDELIQFITHLLFQVRCKIPIVKAIYLYSDISRDISMKAICENISEMLENGINLHEAFMCESKIFGDIIPAILQSAGATGMLENSLNNALIYLQFKKNIGAKIRKVLFYPSFVLLLSISVFMICIAFLAPQVRTLSDDMLQENIPLVTKFCLSIIPDDIMGIIAFFVIIVIIFIICISSKCVRKFFVKISSKLPFVGSLIMKIYEWHFCTIFYISIKSKLDILQSINLVISSFKGTLFEKQLIKMKDEILMGNKLVNSLSEIDFISYRTMLTLKVGEENNNLNESLMYVVNNQDEEINIGIEKLGSRLIITSTLLTGLLLMVILLGLFSPLYSYIDFIGK